MPYCRLLLILVIVFLNSTVTLAQAPAEYSFRHITQEDGLLHNNVLSITQDAKGFIWLVSKNGLQRYDGARFLNYTEMLTNPAEPSATGAMAYADTAANCVWIMKVNKLEKFEPATNTFTLYDIDSLYKYPDFPYEEYTDANNRSWLLGSRSSFSYESSISKYALNYLNSSPFNSHASNSFVTDSTGMHTWMAGNPDGIFLFDKATKKIYTPSFNPQHDPVLEAFSTVIKKKIYPVRQLMKDTRNNYWLTLWNDVFFRYNTVSGKVTTYPLPDIIKKWKGGNVNSANKIINGLYQDNHGTVWLFTENAGLLKYNEAADTFDPILLDEPNMVASRYSYAVNCIFQDREENIWLGTDRGITIFNPYRKYYRAIHHESENPASLPKSEITGFIQAGNGDILAGTWGGGITVYDSNWQFKKNISLAGPVEYNEIWSFIQNDDGNIWVGCQHGYLHIYNPADQSVRSIQPVEMERSTIRCMAKDKQGNIWFGLHNGKIAEWEKASNRFFTGVGQDTTGKPIDVLYIFFDSGGNCWVSTASGFKKFDTGKRMFTAVYLPDSSRPHTISGNTSAGIEQYDDSTLVIGTVYGGLNFFNIKTKQFSHLGAADGLPSSTIYAVKKDEAGNIWFTTDYNLYKFRPPGKKFIRYRLESGDLTSSFSARFFYPLNGARWVTATETELICFTPGKSALTGDEPARVEITGFTVFDTPVFIDSFIAAAQPIRLNYTQNFLTVEFALLSFSNMQQVKYYYRMQGVDNEWVNADTKQFAHYTNLAPGSYVFSVRAENEHYQSAGTSFTIIIAPPFWKKGWFLALVAACLVLLVYFLIRWRINSVRAVEAEKLKVQQLNADQYKNQLELEQIINYFSSSLIDKNSVDDVLWDVAKNLIGRLGFEDCMIYLWNSDKTKMVQRAGYGPKGSIEEIQKQLFDVRTGQGVVGYVMQTKEPLLIADTSRDPRYRADEMIRLSEITVPVIYNNELVGIIDSEHHEKNFFTQQHVQVMSTIATLVATKITSIASEQSLQLAKMEMLEIKEKLSEAKLEALRSQMNPHFIFNCLNSIDNLIQNNDKEKATLYLAKFAKLIRSILETSKANTVPCWKDMETLRVYIELEALRLDNKFSYHISIAPEIMSGDYKVPPLVIQPFVENAIHHGLLNKIDADRKLTIHVWASGNYIHYSVADNGVGRAKASAYKELNKVEHASMGMQISIDRINLFNLHHEGAVIITDLFDAGGAPAGTKVEVTLINQ